MGGGYIGLEFASFFSAIGSNVTVLEMLPKGDHYSIYQREPMRRRVDS